MATRELLEGELSWADNFIIGLLSEEEKYQDVIKDLTSSAVMTAIAAVAETSEEIAQGYLGDYYTAIGKLDRVEDEVNDSVNEDALQVSTDTDKANKQADAETDKGSFDAERATSMVLIEVNADIDRVLDEVRENNESLLSEIWDWLGDATGWLTDTLFGWIPELANDAAIYLASLPAMLLFESFKSFFFEETE